MTRFIAESFREISRRIIYGDDGFQIVKSIECFWEKNLKRKWEARVSRGV